MPEKTKERCNISKKRRRNDAEDSQGLSSKKAKDEESICEPLSDKNGRADSKEFGDENLDENKRSGSAERTIDESAKNNDEDASLLSVLNLLKVQQTRSTGLQKILKLCKQDQENAINFVKSFLKFSPECKELFNIMESEERPNAQVTRLVWEILEKILLVTSDAENSLQSTGLYILNRILNKHIKQIYSAFNSSTHPELTKAVLRLLTAILAQGKQGVIEVLQSFDFTLKALEAVSKKRDRKAKMDVRTCFIRFSLAFLVFGDISSVKQALEIPVLSKGIFNGLSKDPPENVHLVLSTLTDKVIKKAGLLKKTKIAFFNSHNMLQLAQLYISYKGESKDDNEEISETQSAACELITEMLNTLCTDAEFGICFPNKQGILTGRSNNPVLLKFLRSLQKIAKSESKLQDLISRTLATSHDLIIPFISTLGINLEPRMSSPWLNSINFLTQIWSSLPSPCDLLQNEEHAITSSNLQMIIKLNFPSILTKTYLVNGLKQSSLMVKQKSIELILICMKRVLSTISFIQSKKHCDAHYSNTMEEQFIAVVMKQLPEANVVVGVRQSWSSGRKKNKDENEDGIELKNDDGIADADDLDVLILELMKYYQLLQPGIFSNLQFNVSKLFKSDISDDYLNSTILLTACEIASMEPRGVLKWFSKKSDTYSSAMQIIFNAYVISNNPYIKMASKSLIIKLLDESGSFNEHLNEVEAWLEILLLTYEETKDGNLADLFYHICTTTVNQFYSIIDELTEIMAESVVLAQSRKKDLTHGKNERLEFSPLVVGALRFFVKNLNGDEAGKNLGALSRFLTWFLMDKLMSQENPICLLKVIQKYTMLISNQNQESTWISDWCDLNDFACKWSTGIGFQIKESLKGNKNSMNRNLTKKSSTFASTIREIFPLTSSRDLVKIQKKNSEFLGDFRERVTSSLTIRSLEGKLVIGDVQIMLHCLENINEVSLEDNGGFCEFFGNLIEECLKKYEEKNQLNSKRTSEQTKNEQTKLNEMFRMVLNFHLFQKKYLLAEDGSCSNWLTELLELVLSTTKDHRIIEAAACYLENITTSLKEILNDHKCKSSCKDEEILKSLRLFVRLMPLNQCTNLVSDIINACKITDCNERFLASALKILISRNGDGKDVLKTDKSESACSGKMNKEVKNKDILEEDDSTTSMRDEPSTTIYSGPLSNSAKVFGTTILQTQHIKDLFSLLMKNQSSIFDELVLNLLKTDQTTAALAPIQLVDLSFLKSPDRIVIASYLVRSSPLHAKHLIESIVANEGNLDLCELLPIIHSLIFHSSKAIQLTSVDHFQSKINILVSFMANGDTQNNRNNEILVDILIMLCSSLKDKDGLITSLFEILERKTTCLNSDPSYVSLYQLQLFDEIVTENIITNGDYDLAVRTIPTLMKLLELTIIKHGGNAIQEPEIILHEMIRKLCTIISSKNHKVKDIEIKPITDISNSWIKTILKNRFEDSKSMDTVRLLIQTFYSMKKFKKKSKISLQTNFNYILSHSMFLKIMLENVNKHSNKEMIIETLLSIAEMEGSVCEDKHLKVFMAAYSATMSTTDQKLLQLLKIYEDNGISVIASRLFLWGNEGLKRNEEIQKQSSTLYNSPVAKDIMELIDRNMILKSAYNFSLSFDITDPKKNLCIRDDIYDPAILLPVFSFILGPGCEIDCRKFIESGCLSFIIAATSCNQIETRKSAYHILARFLSHFESAGFREKKQIAILLDAFRNAIKDEGIQIPSIICCFLIRCLQIILRADQHMYPIINNFLIQKPCLDIKDVPLLLPMLNSNNLQFSMERSWILKLLVSGFRSSTDYYIYKRRHVFELLMSLYDSPLCDSSSKKSICDLFLAASQIHPASFDLVKNYGLLSWLHSKLHSNEIQSLEFVIQMLSSLKETFQHGFKKLDDDEDNDVKKPKLQNFPLECILICMNLLERNSLSLGPAQVSSVVDVIHWCLLSSNDVIHTATYISRDNMRRLVEACYRIASSHQHLSAKIYQNALGVLHVWLQNKVKLNQDMFPEDLEFVCWAVSIALCIFKEEKFNNHIIIGVSKITKIICKIVSSVHVKAFIENPAVANLFDTLIETLLTIEQPSLSQLRSENSEKRLMETSMDIKPRICSYPIIDDYNITCSSLNYLRFELYRLLAIFMSSVEKNGTEREKLAGYLQQFSNCDVDDDILDMAPLREIMASIVKNPEIESETILSENENFIDCMEMLVMGIYTRRGR